MTNNERIGIANRVAEVMRAHANQLDMASMFDKRFELEEETNCEQYLNMCGSSCCIAGFICATTSPKALVGDLFLISAAIELRISRKIAAQLFCPGSDARDMGFPEDHTMYNTDIDVAIKALYHAVSLQNQGLYQD